MCSEEGRVIVLFESVELKWKEVNVPKGLPKTTNNFYTPAIQITARGFRFLRKIPSLVLPITCKL